MDTTKLPPVKTSIHLLRAEEVAKLLNLSTSLASLLMHSGAIPTVHLNRSVRVRPSDQDEFIQHSLSIRKP